MVEYERVEKVRSRNAHNIKVYNLKTRTGIYFANGMLVHNCGIPVVAIGTKLANYGAFGVPNLEIEVPSMIKNGVNGFTSDYVSDLRNYISQLLDDHNLAKRVGEEGRKTAIEMFGKEKIKMQWKQFFESL